LIEREVASALGGEAKFEYSPDGLTALISISMDHS